MNRQELLTPIVAWLAFGLTVVASGQDVDNPLFASWNKFDVGSSTTMSITTTNAGNAAGDVKMTQTLAEKSGDEIKIEIATTVIVNGKELNTTTQTVTYNRKVAKDSPEANVPERAKTTKGKETIKLGSKEYSCKWVQYEMEVEGTKTITKLWSCDGVPGGNVKQVTKFGEMTTEMELVEFEKK